MEKSDTSKSEVSSWTVQHETIRPEDPPTVIVNLLSLLRHSSPTGDESKQSPFTVVSYAYSVSLVKCLLNVSLRTYYDEKKIQNNTSSTSKFFRKRKLSFLIVHFLQVKT